jgi:hypothetical protein
VIDGGITDETKGRLTWNNIDVRISLVFPVDLTDVNRFIKNLANLELLRDAAGRVCELNVLNRSESMTQNFY